VGREGARGKGGGRGKGGEMTQTLYALMNKRNNKNLSLELKIILKCCVMLLHFLLKCILNLSASLDFLLALTKLLTETTTSRQLSMI
jgi:hypothetical protein